MSARVGLKVVLTILILAGPANLAQSQSASSELFDLTTTPHSYKDPVTAFKLAMFPGFFIHGRGHVYARQKVFATALMTSEVLALMAMGLGFWQNNKPNDFADFPGNGGSAAQAQAHGKKLITYGSFVFVLSWIVDMAHGPIAADRYNTLYGLRPVVRLGPEESPGVLVSLTLRY